MNTLKKQFGKRLKAIREEFHLTQEALAEKINISSRALSSIECGKSFVTAETIENICTALEVSPRNLFDFEIDKIKDRNVENEEQHYYDGIENGTTVYHIVEIHIRRIVVVH